MRPVSNLFPCNSTPLSTRFSPGITDVDIRYRLDGGLLNLARFRSRTNTHVQEFLHADNKVTMNQTAINLQRFENLYSEVYKRFRIKVYIKKTKFLNQLAPRQAIPDVINIVRLLVEVVGVGSILSNSVTWSSAITASI